MMVRLEVPDDVLDAIAQRAAAIVLEQQPDAAGSPWFTVRDGAAYLRISERSLERAIAKGRIRSSTMGSRRLLHRDDLDGFVRAAGEE